MDLMTYALCKGNGGGGSSNKFIVTLTPTAQDFSGTMDKTVAEINEAYEAGQQIWFKMFLTGMGYMMNMAELGNGDPELTYPSFNATFIEISNNVMLTIFTSYTDDGTRQTYFAKAYSLTPVS